MELYDSIIIIIVTFDEQIHKKHITACTVNLAGEDNAGIPIIITRDDDDTIEMDDGIGER